MSIEPAGDHRDAHAIEGPNVSFYSGRRDMRPGVGIEQLLGWGGRYEQLERDHAYIQWLFPNHFQSNFNSSAYPLTKQEANAFREDVQLADRLVRGYEMFLDFLGMRLADRASGRVARSRNKNFNERYRSAFITNTHNHLRIQRMCACLAVTGFYRYVQGFLVFLYFELYGKPLHLSALGSQRPLSELLVPGDMRADSCLFNNKMVQREFGDKWGKYVHKDIGVLLQYTRAHSIDVVAQHAAFFFATVVGQLPIGQLSEPPLKKTRWADLGTPASASTQPTASPSAASATMPSESAPVSGSTSRASSLAPPVEKPEQRRSARLQAKGTETPAGKSQQAAGVKSRRESSLAREVVSSVIQKAAATLKAQSAASKGRSMETNDSADRGRWNHFRAGSGKTNTSPAAGRVGAPAGSGQDRGRSGTRRDGLGGAWVSSFRSDSMSRRPASNELQGQPQLAQSARAASPAGSTRAATPTGVEQQAEQRTLNSTNPFAAGGPAETRSPSADRRTAIAHDEEVARALAREIAIDMRSLDVDGWHPEHGGSAERGRGATDSTGRKRATSSSMCPFGWIADGLKHLCGGTRDKSDSETETVVQTFLPSTGRLGASGSVSRRMEHGDITNPSLNVLSLGPGPMRITRPAQAGTAMSFTTGLAVPHAAPAHQHQALVAPPGPWQVPHAPPPGWQPTGIPFRPPPEEYPPLLVGHTGPSQTVQRFVPQQAVPWPNPFALPSLGPVAPVSQTPPRRHVPVVVTTGRHAPPAGVMHTHTHIAGRGQSNRSDNMWSLLGGGGPHTSSGSVPGNRR